MRSKLDPAKIVKDEINKTNINAKESLINNLPISLIILKLNLRYWK